MIRRLRLSLRLAVVAIAMSLAALGAIAPALAAPGAPVPQGFVGVDIDGPVTAQGTSIDLADQMRAMVGAGVETVRVAFNWAAAEPRASLSQIPADERSAYTVVDGVPIDFGPTDAIVAAAARDHLAVLPTILYAPAWDAVDNPGGVAYPRRPGPYGAFAAALVKRYGPHGTFWSANPQLPVRPIREWQIWNEPNLPYYWRQPFQSGYARLLTVAHGAIKRADPGAQVVLGALTNRAWDSLLALHAHRPGIGRMYDVVAVNGFTRLPRDVIRYLQYTRRAMNRVGDRTKPLLATEVSWPSALHQTKINYDFDTTEAGQARNIAALLPMLGAQREALNLQGFDYYTWMGAEASGNPAFDFAGLLADRDGTVSAKPALAAYRHAALVLEHCAGKGATATVCLR